MEGGAPRPTGASEAPLLFDLRASTSRLGVQSGPAAAGEPGIGAAADGRDANRDHRERQSYRTERDIAVCKAYGSNFIMCAR